MKKTILILTVSVFIAGTMFSSCQSQAKKVENAELNLQEAKNNVWDAKQDLYKAQKDSAIEYQQFKKVAEEKIIAHEKSIAEFKARMDNQKKENKAQYEKKLTDLEQKNSDMKKKLEDYKEEGKDKWEIFKAAFNHDMNQLEKAFKDLTTKKG